MRSPKEREKWREKSGINAERLQHLRLGRGEAISKEAQEERVMGQKTIQESLV